MLKLAFTSCACLQVYRKQPVWDWIAQERPDHLVLLGDCVYLDIATTPIPQDMLLDEFAQHLYARYSAQLLQPSLRALCQQLGPNRVHAIWDDHDFLWDDANGAELAGHPAHREKIAMSSAFFTVFRRCLQGAPWPATYRDAVFWQADAVLATPSIALEPDIWLHLSDGRSARTHKGWPRPEAQRALLGSAQRSLLGQRIEAAPEALHLLASGSTLSAWRRYPADWQWLLDVSASRRVLVLSGDIHRNETDAFFTNGRFPLHEATSSGAAIKDTVVIGKPRRNFGLLQVDPDQVQWRLFSHRDEEAPKRRTLSRATMLPA